MITRLSSKRRSLALNHGLSKLIYLRKLEIFKIHFFNILLMKSKDGSSRVDTMQLQLVEEEFSSVDELI